MILTDLEYVFFQVLKSGLLYSSFTLLEMTLYVTPMGIKKIEI